MFEYLWDLTLDKLPCGWENTYQEALINCPDGELIPSEEHWGETQRNYFYHPVKYRQLILETFNNYKAKAIELMNKKDTLDFKEFINQIVQIDIVLYNLISHWITDEEEFDINSFNPNNFYNEINNKDYFDSSEFKANEFEKLKLIRFSNDNKFILF